MVTDEGSDPKLALSEEGSREYVYIYTYIYIYIYKYIHIYIYIYRLD